MNLAVNARDAMPDGGVLTIETANVEAGTDGIEGAEQLPPDCYVRLRVRDTGVGMAPDVAARAFEPFFTTRAGQGTGLGLATVYGIVRQAGGHAAIMSRPGEGTMVEVHLPAKPAAVATAATRETAPVRYGQGEHVLVVEDEIAVGQSTLRILERGGYRVTLVQEPAAALAALKRGGIDLAVSDVVMPDVRGPALIARLREHQPDLQVLYMSGYVGAEVQGEEVDPLIAKPFTANELLERVAAALDGSSDGQTLVTA
jgi:CheY-like chemotaxis protein